MKESDIIWACGGRNSSSKVHAFVSKEAFEKGEAICGRNLKPSFTIPEWDIDNPEAADNTCPYCRGRIMLLRIPGKK